MEHTLRSWIAGALGVDPVGVQLVARAALEHQSNRLYDVWSAGRHLILKQYLRPSNYAVAPVREYHALQLLADLDLAPYPVLLDRSPMPGVGPLVVYDYMDGRMWGRRRPTSGELAQLADVWLRVHSVTNDALRHARRSDRSWDTIAATFCSRFERYAAWAHAVYPEGVGAAALCLEQLGRCAALGKLATLAPRLCFSRADARFANVIRRPDGRVGLVDWEDSGLRDPARDVADLLTHPEQEDLLTPGAWQAFLQPYLAVQAPADPSLRHRIDLYRAIFPLFWLALLLTDGVARCERGAATNWTVNGMAVNERLRRYLARAQAWPDECFTTQLADLDDISFFNAAEPHSE